MKINLHNFLLIVLGMILFNSNVFAQRGSEKSYADPLMPTQKTTPIYIGPAVGLNIMGHSMTVPTFVDDNICPSFENAAGTGFYGGLTLEYLFGDVTTSSSSLIFRVLFNMFSGSNTLAGEPMPVMGGNGQPVNSTCENVLDINYNAATFEVMYKINPIPRVGLGIVVGPTFDFVLTKNWKHDYNLIDPSNARFGQATKDKYPDAQFSNLDRTITFYDREIDDASAIRLGLKVGVQYEILLGAKWYIVPSVAYNFGITSVTSQYTWRVSPIQIGIDARFAF